MQNLRTSFLAGLVDLSLVLSKREMNAESDPQPRFLGTYFYPYNYLLGQVRIDGLDGGLQVRDGRGLRLVVPRDLFQSSLKKM